MPLAADQISYYAPPNLGSRRFLIYDAKCSFCSKLAHLLKRWDKRNRFELLPHQSAQAKRRLEGLTPDEQNNNYHFIDERGNILSGDAVIPVIFRQLPFGKIPAFCFAHFPARKKLLEKFYSWVASRQMDEEN